MGGDFERVARFAERQHGRITWAQIMATGVTAKQAQAWCRDGLLRRKHRGVYAVGHAAPSRLAGLKAAELAGGDGAAVSHASSACLLGLISQWPARPEITVPVADGRRRPGITIHRVDKVDCHWPDHNLTVELLGYRFHNSRQAFEQDVARRRRSGHFAFTWGDVFEREAATASEVAALLSRPG